MLVRIELLVQYQSIFHTVLVDEQAEVGLLGFALAFDRLAKAKTSVFVSGLLLVVVVIFVDQIVTNFFIP